MEGKALVTSDEMLQLSSWDQVLFLFVSGIDKYITASRKKGLHLVRNRIPFPFH